MNYSVSFHFTKTGLMRYISHLDLMRLFVRAMRRAGLPVKITQGFNPHPKLSLKRALKLGVESEDEEGTVYLNEFVPMEEFASRLNKQLPEGVRIKELWLKKF